MSVTPQIAKPVSSVEAPAAISPPVTASGTRGVVGLGDDDSDEDVPKLNTVEDLRKGVIKTQRNKANIPYTILLVGETGVGKSAVLEFIANVLAGKPALDYDLTIIDKDNEAGGSKAGSQTNEARVYKFKSQNGIEVNILDTPGLADTRGIQQDELHKKSIAEQIERHIPYVHAIIILANGTQTRESVGTAYALNTLSTLFPKSIRENIGFLFTMVVDKGSRNFPDDNIPPELKQAPQFHLDNPAAAKSKLDSLRATPGTKKRDISGMKDTLLEREKKALEMLTDFFDWLDGREPQPTTDILTLYEKSQSIELQITDTVTAMEQAAEKRRAMDAQMESVREETAAVDAYAQYKQWVTTKEWRMMPSSSHNTLCNQSSCYQNCHERCQLDFSIDSSKLRGCWAMIDGQCRVCHHSLSTHSHHRSHWKEVEDGRVVEEPTLKAKWNAAKTEAQRREAALNLMRSSLDQLTRSIALDTERLMQLADEYAQLSLSGSFTVQVSKAIDILTTKLAGMRVQGASKVELNAIEAALTRMENKLKVLQDAKAKEKKERAGILKRAAQLVTG